MGFVSDEPIFPATCKQVMQIRKMCYISAHWTQIATVLHCMSGCSCCRMSAIVYVKWGKSVGIFAHTSISRYAYIDENTCSTAYARTHKDMHAFAHAWTQLHTHSNLYKPRDLCIYICTYDTRTHIYLHTFKTNKWKIDVQIRQIQQKGTKINISGLYLKQFEIHHYQSTKNKSIV